MNVPGSDRCRTVEAHGLNWRVVEDFADVVREVDVFRLRTPDRLAELVKDNRARTVARLANPAAPQGPALYVKRFKLPGVGRKIKALLRGTQGMREWKTSRALRRRGIPTCRVLAVAERRPGLLPREAFLISEEIDGAVPLKEHLDGLQWTQCPASRRLALIEELADLTAAMIRSGVCHADLHVGNVMIVPQAPAGQRLYVLDLHRVRLARPSRRRVTRMLVYLADSTVRFAVSDADRLRFLRRVLRKWRGEEAADAATVRAWAKRVRRAWEKHDRRHMRSRTKRCLMETSEYTRDRSEHFRLYRRREFSVRAALEVVDQHRLALSGQPDRCRVRKDGPRTEISYCTRSEVGPLFVKAFLRSGWRDRLKSLLRPRTRAKGAWVAHRGFRVRGLPAPEGKALLEARDKTSGRPDYLLTEAVDVLGDLQQVTLAMRAESPDHERMQLSKVQRRELGAEVAELFRLLARRGARHRDMKPSNILVQVVEEEGLRLWLVDLERARFEVEWKRRHWVYHLAQCNAGLPEEVTVLERMRCLRRCGRGRWSARERLEVAREVLEVSLKRNPQWRR